MRSKLTRIPCKGFTLIELLLGVLIASIIGVAVYQLFAMGIQLDERSRVIHTNHVELLMADQLLSHDLHNAVMMDLSSNYPDKKVFDGHKNEMSFIVPTSKGMRRVKYYSGMVDWGKITKTIVTQRTDLPSNFIISSHQTAPIEFLLRQQMSLGDWVNDKLPQAEIIAAGLKKDSFSCQYAPPKDSKEGQSSAEYQFKDDWDQTGLPFVVRCVFNLYDSNQPLVEHISTNNIFNDECC